MIVWLLFAASLINYLDPSSISLALPLLSRDLGLGVTFRINSSQNNSMIC
jgi:hypothetical protein